jgi:hypothetical protein
MTLGPQFYPKGPFVEEGQNLRTDATLYHGTGGDIKGGVVRPGERGFFGPGAYATENPRSAEFYAKESAESEGRLFGTVYEVTPVSGQAKHVGSEAGSAVVADPEGLTTERIVSFPLVHDYSEENKRYKQTKDDIMKHVL